MTRRLITALVLLLSSLLLCVFSVCHISREIDKAVKIITSQKEITEKSQMLNNHWQKNRKLFSVFLKHTDADFLERNFLELERACKSENFTLADEILSELYSYLLVTKEAEKLKAENIF